jgi:antitoxin FitA
MMKGAVMGSLTISGLDERLVASLREQALRHGRSVEEEAREILREGVQVASPPGEQESFGAAIRALVARHGPVDLDLPPRERLGEPPDMPA